eukprot:TRINITY_DN56091_c0_g1_i1.p1 TRINITY_DN56091_c0_g1~~TRINITY_DN56091_c0_g1_i1.p1  ORF type:complete len:336 (+),score=44.56 TRINITY_DN56091_c0_g1_i1:221-1228(+)
MACVFGAEDCSGSGMTSRADASSTIGTTCADEKRLSVSSSGSEDWCDDSAYHGVVFNSFDAKISVVPCTPRKTDATYQQVAASAGERNGLNLPVSLRKRQPSQFSMVSDGDDDLEVSNVQNLEPSMNEHESDPPSNRNLFATYDALDGFCLVLSDGKQEARTRAATVIQAAVRGSIVRRRTCHSNPVLSHSALLASLQPISVERLREEAQAIRKKLMQKRARKQSQKLNSQISRPSPGQACQDMPPSSQNSSPKYSKSAESGEETDSTRPSTNCSTKSSTITSMAAHRHLAASDLQAFDSRCEDDRKRRHSRVSTRKQVDHLVADAMRRMAPCPQ